MSRAGLAIGGRYRLDELLASGGMGTVWKAWDERLQRVVAVKQLHLDPSLPPADREIAVARMMREARITAQLHHPNAVSVFDVIDEDGRPNIVMQFIPSRSLQEVLAADGPLAPPAVGRLGVQVAAALAAAHRVGIVHRDVKPANILIDTDGVARITDFGIAHTIEDATLTSAGMVTGTPAYLAPEVARGERSDAASDVWSLGATLYAAGEGHPPFGTDGTPMAVLHRVASGRFRAPQRSGPLTPLLEAMLSTDPAARPSMLDVSHSLSLLTDAPTTNLRAAAPTVPTEQAGPGPTQTLAAGSTAPPPPSAALLSGSPSVPPVHRSTARRRTSWWPIATAAVVVVIAAVLAVVLLSNTGSGRPVASGSSSSPAGSTSSSRSAAPRTSSSTQQARTPTAVPPAPKKSAPKKSGQGHGGGGGSADAGQLAGAITEYFGLVPNNLDAAWQRLTPSFQNGRAGGRATFDSYWNSISGVDVSNANGQPPSTATATLTYHYKDGRTVTETTTFRLVRQDGVLKIDGEN